MNEAGNPRGPSRRSEIQKHNEGMSFVQQLTLVDITSGRRRTTLGRERLKRWVTHQRAHSVIVTDCIGCSRTAVRRSALGILSEDFKTHHSCHRNHQTSKSTFFRYSQLFSIVLAEGCMNMTRYVRLRKRRSMEAEKFGRNYGIIRP